MTRLRGIASPVSGSADAYIVNLRLATLDAKDLDELSRHQFIVELALGGTTLDDSAMAVIAKLKNLQRLDLAWTFITPEGIAPLEGLASLTELNVSYTGIHDAAFASVGRLRSLKRLGLDRSQATPEALRELEKHERLEVIYEHDGDRRIVWERGRGAKGSEWFWEGPKPVATPGWEYRGMLEKVVERLGGQLFLDEVDEKEVPGTYFVKLTGARFEPRQLKQLERFQSIVNLSLSHTRANDESMESVARLKNLRNLYLSKSEVTAKGIATLSELPSLTQLFLEETRIHGSDFSCILKLPQLRDLWIDETQTTVSALRYFDLHPSLQEIMMVNENEKQMAKVWSRGWGNRDSREYWKKD